MANRYWVGGSGNWSDTNHWSTTSGGSGGASVPGPGDIAIIDNVSGSSDFTITCDVDPNVSGLQVNNIYCTFETGGRTLTVGSNGLTVSACKKFGSTSSWTFYQNGPATFSDTQGDVRYYFFTCDWYVNGNITTSGSSGFTFSGAMGTCRIQSPMTINASVAIVVGHLEVNANLTLTGTSVSILRFYGNLTITQGVTVNNSGKRWGLSLGALTTYTLTNNGTITSTSGTGEFDIYGYFSSDITINIGGDGTFRTDRVIFSFRHANSSTAKMIFNGNIIVSNTTASNAIYLYVDNSTANLYNVVVLNGNIDASGGVSLGPRANGQTINFTINGNLSASGNIYFNHGGFSNITETLQVRGLTCVGQVYNPLTTVTGFNPTLKCATLTSDVDWVIGSVLSQGNGLTLDCGGNNGYKVNLTVNGAMTFNAGKFYTSEAGKNWNLYGNFTIGSGATYTYNGCNINIKNNLTIDNSANTNARQWGNLAVDTDKILAVNGVIETINGVFEDGQVAVGTNSRLISKNHGGVAKYNRVYGKATWSSPAYYTFATVQDLSEGIVMDIRNPSSGATEFGFDVDNVGVKKVQVQAGASWGVYSGCDVYANELDDRGTLLTALPYGGKLWLNISPTLPFRPIDPEYVDGEFDICPTPVDFARGVD